MGRRDNRTPPLPPKRRGPNGERLCRMCGAAVPKGRLEWCSQACVDVRLLQNQAGARQVLRKRDRGVCASCGLDTKKFQRLCGRVWRLVERLCRAGPHLADPRHRHADAVMHRWVRGRLGRAEPTGRRTMFDLHRSFWEADHTVPLVEGGGHGLDNLRTLCRWCHADETAKLAARRAQKRKDEATRG